MKLQRYRAQLCLALCLPLLLALSILAGCAAGGDVTRPVPSAFYPAPQTARRMVVMLPGIADNLEALQRRHVAALIQQSWPDADVVLTGLTLPFYKEGDAAKRLQDDVISRYPHDGHALWLAGISLGGMGVLLYDRQYPDKADGMLLFSPYLGESDIHDEIRQAGGLAKWDPGPPQAFNADTFQHELWRYIKQLRDRPQRTRTLWLAYGADEKFRDPIEMMSPMLPADHVLMLPGHHDWDLWQRAFYKLFPLADRAVKH